MATITEQLRARREALGLNLPQLAAKVSELRGAPITRQAVAGWEARDVGASTLEEWARALGARVTLEPLQEQLHYLVWEQEGQHYTARAELAPVGARIVGRLRFVREGASLTLADQHIPDPAAPERDRLVAMPSPDLAGEDAWRTSWVDLLWAVAEDLHDSQVTQVWLYPEDEAKPRIYALIAQHIEVEP